MFMIFTDFTVVLHVLWNKNEQYHIADMQYQI